MLGLSWMPKTRYTKTNRSTKTCRKFWPTRSWKATPKPRLRQVGPERERHKLSKTRPNARVSGVKLAISSRCVTSMQLLSLATTSAAIWIHALRCPHFSRTRHKTMKNSTWVKNSTFMIRRVSKSTVLVITWNFKTKKRATLYHLKKRSNSTMLHPLATYKLIFHYHKCFSQNCLK